MTSNFPSVSIVIPTYNRAKILPMAVWSVLSQSYSDFEVIIVDDASSDNTEDIVKAIGDERIRYIRHQNNKGATAARNTGINAASGEYIAFQDSDDEWLPGKLERQMGLFSSVPPDVGVVYCGFNRQEDGGHVYIPSPRIKQKDGNILQELLMENFVATPTMVVRRSCFDTVGMFDENLPRFQDWEIAIRLAEHYSFLCIDEPLLIAHRFDDSISTDRTSLVTALEMILTKHNKTLTAAGRQVLAKWHFTVGTALCQAGNIEKGRRYIGSAIKTFPFNPRYWPSFFVVVVLGETVYMKFVQLYLAIEKLKNRFMGREKAS